MRRDKMCPPRLEQQEAPAAQSEQQSTQRMKRSLRHTVRDVSPDDAAPLKGNGSANAPLLFPENLTLPLIREPPSHQTCRNVVFPAGVEPALCRVPHGGGVLEDFRERIDQLVADCKDNPYMVMGNMFPSWLGNSTPASHNWLSRRCSLCSGTSWGPPATVVRSTAGVEA
ncbi:uncharacterized protein LOC143476332 [Brachyhypopomus gauderio]|uniref:uncharacterized protein LOC143476332 n=1 Tax=Brachyhypopomus gauderio TaxID=698409 RepID=UPI0040435CBC